MLKPQLSLQGRIYLRLNGSDSGCVAKLPESFTDLLAIAQTKLYSGGGTARRIFAASSDEIVEEDFELIEHNDVLYVSAGEDWMAPGSQTLTPAAAQSQPARRRRHHRPGAPLAAAPQRHNGGKALCEPAAAPQAVAADP